MKYDFTKPICDINGSPFNENGKPVTLSDLALIALLAQPDGAKISIEEKLARYELAKRVRDNSDAELTDGEVRALSQIAGEMFAPGTVGPMFEALTPKPNTSEPVQLEVVASGAV